MTMTKVLWLVCTLNVVCDAVACFVVVCFVGFCFKAGPSICLVHSDSS